MTRIAIKISFAVTVILFTSRESVAEAFRYTDRDGRKHIVASAKAQKFERQETAPPERSARVAYPYADHVREAADLYALPVELLLAVIKVESSFDPFAVSRAGAMGLMQLMPKTAKELGVTDPFEPRQNILGGARYLRILVNGFDGDIAVAIGAYHAGYGALSRNGRVPPALETRRYVATVLRYYHRYSTQGFDAPRRARLE